MMKFNLKIFLTLFAFAFFLACSKDSDNEPEPTIVQITGLDFTITTNEENPLQVGVTPTATGATSYKIYFDFEGAPTTFETSDGTIVTHTYPEGSADYIIKVVASNSNGADDVATTKPFSITVTPDTILADFENTSGAPFLSDGETPFESVEGPIGDNTTRIGKITNVSTDDPNWEAGFIVNNKYIDLTDPAKRVISIDFYQETAATPNIGIKFENTLTDGAFAIEMTKRAAEVEGWQTIEFDFGTNAVNSFPNHENPTVTFDQYQIIAIFIGFGERVDGVHYIDNLTGGLFSDTNVPDTDGDTILDPVDVCVDTAGTIESNGCPSGPTTAAEAPALDAADVISYFSNAYTNQEMTTWASQYSANASVEEVVINGNDVLKLSITAENGYALADVATVNDVSVHNALHLDVWSATNQSIVVKVVDYGANREFGTGAPNYAAGGDDSEQALEIAIEVSAGWNSVSKQLTGVNTNFAQFVLSAEQSGVIYLDNIYFFTDTFASGDVQFTVSVPATATTVTFQSSLYSWDPNVAATDNGDGTWSYSISPAPAAAIEYVWWVDGNSESASLIAAAANGDCTALIDGTNFNTDYFSYANRKWSPGDGNQSGTYGSCAASVSTPDTATFTVSVPATATTVTFQSSLYSWDPNVAATDNGDGTWSYSISPAPAAAIEYVWWVDGNSESASLIAAAANGDCTALIDGTNFNTDYFSYANRKWSPGGGNQSGTYGSCAN